MWQHAREPADRSAEPAPRAHPRRGHCLHHREHGAADGAFRSRAPCEDDDWRGRVRDVAAGRTSRGDDRRLLCGDRSRRLHPVHVDGSARGEAATRAALGRGDAALGGPHAAVVDERGDGPRHPRRADQDRGAGNGECRHRDVRGRRARGAAGDDHDHLRPARGLAPGRVGGWPGASRRGVESDGRRRAGEMTATTLTAAQAGLVACETCGLLSRPADAADPGYCPRCGGELESRRRQSIQYTWALVIAAAICYIPANVLPVLTTNALGSSDSDTIMGGVVLLYNTGSWPLALVVLIASVMVPLGKLVALTYLLVTVQRGSLRGTRDRTRLYRMVDFIGRWSMLDVFVDTFTVALVQLQPLMSVEPGPGVLFFAAVVVLTMLAAESFDPRLIWDARSERTQHDG